jgi:hypothetical protein
MFLPFFIGDASSKYGTIPCPSASKLITKVTTGMT